jgi:hypothetical protein
MNCLEFDELWNDLLDAEPMGRPAPRADVPDSASPPSARELAAAAHAEACPRCRASHDRYVRLTRAIRDRNTGLHRFLAPSPGLTQRILAAVGQSSGRNRLRRAALPLGTAAAAAVILLALAVAPMPWSPQRPWTGTRRESGTPPETSPSARRSDHPSRGRDLNEALADATEATWDLAWTTSGPAARLGRQMIVAAASTQHTPDASSTTPGHPRLGFDALAQVLRVVPDSTSGSELIQDLGDDLSSSVRPLSSSARQAFGFLRALSPGKPGNPITQPASKGA